MTDKTFNSNMMKIFKSVDSLKQQLDELYHKHETSSKEGIKKNTEGVLKSTIKKIQRER